MTRTAAFVAALAIAAPAVAHHGGGTFDPVYFTGQYSGSDVVAVADLPYKPDPCKEQAFVDYSKAAPNTK